MPPLAKLIKSVGNMTNSLARSGGGGRRVELENWSKGRGGEVATSWGRRLGRKEIGTSCRKEKQVKMRNSNQENSTKY